MSNLLWLTFKKFLKPPTVCDKQVKLASSVVNMLAFLQSWPRESSISPSMGELLRYIFVFMYCNTTTFMVTGFIFWLYFTTGVNYNEVAVNFSYSAIAITGGHYCFHLFSHRHLCKKLLEEMGDFRKYDKPDMIELADSVLNGIFTLVLYILITLIPIALCYILFTTCEVEDYECGLAYPAYVPGFMTSYRRKILLVLQFTTTGSYNALGLAVLWIGVNLTEYLVQYLKQCQIMTRKLSTIEDSKTRKYLARRLVRYHQRILYLYNDYRTVVGGLYAVHAISTPVILAMMLYSIIVKFQVQMFFTFVGILFTFFGICFMGQRLINESNELANVVYDSIPLDGDVYIAKMLLFVLQQTQRPLRVPSGSLTFCGYELFAQVLKASYSFLTLIQSRGDE